MNAVSRNVALPFQEELEQIEREPPPLHLRLTTLALAALVIAAITIAALTRVDMNVTGHGRLASETPLSVLQPLDRAIVRTLRVRAGDAVRKGQVMATLDGTFTGADLQAVLYRLDHLTAEAERLRAEMAGELYQPRPDPNDRMQATLSAQRLREYRARLASYQQTLAQDDASIATETDHVKALRHQVEVARQVLTLRETLLRGAVGSRLQYLDALAELGRETGNLAAAQDKLAELAHAKLSHAADRDAFVEGWRRDIADLLSKNRDAISDAEAAVAKANRLQQLVQVTAPEDGVVLDVAARGPGSVLKEAEPLFMLLPAGSRLQADISIKSADIGYLRVGDPVTVKIDAYPYQRHGVLNGIVHAISAASVDVAAAPGEGESSAMHRVTIELTGGKLTDLPPGTGPIPGMTVSADIRVGTRSVLAYFMAPITRGFSNSLREP